MKNSIYLIERLSKKKRLIDKSFKHIVKFESRVESWLFRNSFKRFRSSV